MIRAVDRSAARFLQRCALAFFLKAQKRPASYAPLANEPIGRFESILARERMGMLLSPQIRPAIAFGICTTIAAALIANAIGVGAAVPAPSQDSAFATKAAQGGAAEVADARQALQTSRNQRVDVFANRMVVDHSKANVQLAAIMRQQGISQPANIGPDNQAVYSRIEALTGRAFDVAYFAAERSAHEETIALFTREIRTGKDRRLVMFAKATLPVLKMHMAMLR
jgi:putative membrane protein